MRAGDVIKEKYELTRLAGAGGMGEVFEAVNVRIDRKVAVKLLRADLTSDSRVVERFLREARSAGQVGSEHIVEILDSDETDEGVPFLVMEYLEGEDLGRVLYREGPLEPQRAISLVLQACKGLAAAHKKGIIHRDVKPANLFLTHREDGSEWIKVLDFGIAKFRGPISAEDASLTVTGSTVGTPRYMAPEHLREAKSVDERADVFSVGVILYEALTGDHPFNADTFADLIIQMVTVGPTPPSQLRRGLDTELDAIVLRALECDVSDRFASIDDLMRALTVFLDSRGEPGPTSTRDPKTAVTLVSDTIVPTGDDPWAARGSTPAPDAPTQPASNKFKRKNATEEGLETPDGPGESDRKPRFAPWMIAVVVGVAVVTVVVLFAVFFEERPTDPAGGGSDLLSPAGDATVATDADTETEGDGDLEEEAISITVEHPRADADAGDAAPEDTPIEVVGPTPRVKVRPVPRDSRPEPAPSPPPQKPPPRPTGEDGRGEPRFDEAFPRSTSD